MSRKSSSASSVLAVGAARQRERRSLGSGFIISADGHG
jgi:hypothetical protein